MNAKKVQYDVDGSGGEMGKWRVERGGLVERGKGWEMDGEGWERLEKWKEERDGKEMGE